jgi:hypothetical protein
MFRRILFLAPLAIVATQLAFAASPSVTAVLSDSHPEVGQMLQLEIKVNGAQSANVPETISIDGLEIHQTGTSRQFEMHNFDVTSSVTYNYTILPQKAGHFKIPPQTVRVGNDSLKTPELVLNVAQGSNKSAGPSGPSAGTSQSGQAAVGNTLKPWARLTLIKNEAYIGQPIEAQIEVGLDARIRIDPQSIQVGPEIDTPGFVVRRAEQIQQVPRIVNGVRQRVFIYKVAIIPAKPGHFEISANLNSQIQIPIARRPSEPRTHWNSPLDEMLDEMDRMMRDGVNRYSEPTPLKITSDAVAIGVKPLPPNAPASFSGAVGNFTMAADAKPKNVQVGDPITVTSTITGRGNFDRMNAPALEDEHGWHKYPASSKFKQDDDVGISGEKTFEMVLAPNEKKSAVPPLLFAYFDPAKENYVTLRSDAAPITVEGGAAPAPTVAATSSVVPSVTPTTRAATTPVPVAKPADILYQMNDLGVVRSFQPLYARPIFWIAQLAPLVLLLGFLGWKIRQAKSGDRERQRIAARQQEVSNLLRELRRGEVSPQIYFSQAARVVHLKTALAKNINPNAVDAETVAKTFGLNDNERAQLRRLFERSDELSYSGSGNGAEKISREERDEVLRFLESLRA